MASILLVCAVVVALAVGVFLAQGLCVMMFEALRVHARQVAAARTPPAKAVAMETVRS